MFRESIDEMNSKKEFIIPFVGLKIGNHQFEYKISNSFFEIFDFNEFEKSDISVNVSLEKQPNLLELNFKHKGIVQVPCDITGDLFDLSIKGKIKLIVRFGERFNDDNEELLILPLGSFEVNIAQYIYEMIVLSVPLKRINPKAEVDFLELEDLDNEKTVKKERKENIKEEIQKNIDPRWEKLKQLLTEK